MIEGVRKLNAKECTVYYIDQFSEGLKEEIRKHLSKICFGAINSDTGLITYSYKSTVKEFVKRFSTQSVDKNRQKGMIGELLFHVLMTFENDFCATSMFFNLEERSFKKGFDISFYNTENQELWIVEVKSGEKQKCQSNQSIAIVNLINLAKNDLKDRLNTSNTTLWINAINHARIALSDIKDEKKVVIKLLGEYSDQSQKGIHISTDKNVILVGVIFHTLNEEVSPEKIFEKHNQVKKDKLFNKHMTIAIQKSTYEAVVRFLESEAADE